MLTDDNTAGAEYANHDPVCAITQNNAYDEMVIQLSSQKSQQIPKHYE